mmetsp:Transcript_90488/g.255435  ORF Transcript_90488/g.255435 Transcript_90488/m.255435 type:complete len:275 (+) Transcript_90488:803-1627(+)
MVIDLEREVRRFRGARAPRVARELVPHPAVQAFLVPIAPQHEPNMHAEIAEDRFALPVHHHARVRRLAAETDVGVPEGVVAHERFAEAVGETQWRADGRDLGRISEEAVGSSEQARLVGLDDRRLEQLLHLTSLVHLRSGPLVLGGARAKSAVVVGPSPSDLNAKFLQQRRYHRNRLRQHCAMRPNGVHAHEPWAIETAAPGRWESSASVGSELGSHRWHRPLPLRHEGEVGARQSLRRLKRSGSGRPWPARSAERERQGRLLVAEGEARLPRV